MSKKRKDNKNRILLTGESQRSDGRYAFKYTDNLGKVQFVYFWKLVATDKVPAGKKDDLSLREKEKDILRDLDGGIDSVGKKMKENGIALDLISKITGLSKKQISLL